MIQPIRNSPFDVLGRALYPKSSDAGTFTGLLRSLPKTNSGNSGSGAPASPGEAAPFDLEKIPKPGDLVIPNPTPNPWDTAAITANLNAVNQYYNNLQSYRDEFSYESAYNQWVASGAKADDPESLAPTRENTGAAFLARTCGAAGLIQNCGKGPDGLDADTALQKLANGGNVVISAMGKIFKPQAGGPVLQAQEVIAKLSAPGVYA